MPIYEHVCPTCQQRVEVFRTIKGRNTFETCPGCGRLMYRVIIPHGATHVFKEITLDHIADKPMTFTSKKALLRECRKRKVTCPAHLL